MKKVLFKTLFIVLSFLLFLPASVRAGQDQNIGTSRWVIDDVIVGDTVPFAIGHRGYGVNLGEIPDNPIENTKKAVRRAFREGVMIVEVDANLTADNVAVALHDDYFFNEFPFDYTCINQLTLEELKEIMPKVSTLRQILQKAKTFSRMDGSDRPSGQVVVEIKTPAPICVPLAEEQDALQDLVDAVLDDIRSARMESQVTIESFSPEILVKAASGAPDIPRMLALDAGQFLPLELIEVYTEYDVRIINKDSFGLIWGEVGIQITDDLFLGFFRWPGYFTEEPPYGPLGNYMRVLGEDITASSIASLDKYLLFMAGDLGLSASLIVYALHFGLPEMPPWPVSVLVFTVDFGDPEDPGYPDNSEWLFLSEAGVDGMYVDDIPQGLDMEGP